MHLQVRLLHCDGGRRVVLVSAHEGERLLGSALGEAGDAEEAEDRARARLLTRLQSPGPGQEGPTRAPEAPARAPAALSPVSPLPASPAPASPPPQPAAAPLPVPAPTSPVEDPQDWSAELTHLDLQLRRLGWDREREAAYLQRCFGHPSRDRITVYADLIAYLRAVEGLEPGCDPATAPVPLRRADLLEQGNLLLQQMGWDGSMGRNFLEKHLGVSSRQQLNDADLLRFNMLLEEVTLRASADGPTPPGPEAGG